MGSTPINPRVSDLCVGVVHNPLTRGNNPPLAGISQDLVLLTFIIHKFSTSLSENT